jgi:uncharacterized membrane protein (DUF2068 family)
MGLRKNRWHPSWLELIRCAMKGHITAKVADDAVIDARLSGTCASGTLRKCLRCESWILTDEPTYIGPKSLVPEPRRGKSLRQALIIRGLAIERGVRAIIMLAVAYGLWKFQQLQAGLQMTYMRDLPLLKKLNVDSNGIVQMIHAAIGASPKTVSWIAMFALIYGAVEAAECVGLWLEQRWGEYFAAVATFIFIPLEVYELTKDISYFKIGALVINILALVWLIYVKRLFGVRGGKRAHEASKRTASVIAIEQKALAAAV